MSRRFMVVILAVALVVALGAGSIHGAAKAGGVFTMAVASSPPTLDWHTTTARATPVYGGMYIWEGLTALDEKFIPQPMLADRWEISSNKLEWTFYLRKGVKFHNGKEMTSDDVVASLKRWRQVTPRADTMERVKDFVAVDKYTVKFILSGPMATLPYVLAQEGAQPVIHPKEIIENAPVNKLPAYVGTGPYKFVEWVQGQQVVVERFNDYTARTDEKKGLAGKKVAYFDKIVFRNIPESEIRLAGLQTGQFDAAAPLNQEYLPQLEKMSGVQPLIIKFDMKPVMFFSFAENSIMKNVRMRKAIRAALNMDDIMFAATGNKAFYDLDPDQLFFGFQGLWSDTGKEFFNMKNVALAKQLAKDAGYKGEPIRFLASLTQFHHRRPCIQATEQLRDAGFNIFLDMRDWATVSTLQKDPTKWDLSYARTVLYFPAEIQLVKNIGGFTSPECEKALDAISTETDFEKVRAIIETFKKEVIIEQVPWLTFGDMFALYGQRAWVKNLQPMYTHPLWNVWFEGKS